MSNNRRKPRPARSPKGDRSGRDKRRASTRVDKGAPPAGDELKTPAGGKPAKQARASVSSHASASKRNKKRAKTSSARGRSTGPGGSKQPKDARRTLSSHPEAVRSRRRRSQARRRRERDVGTGTSGGAAGQIDEATRRAQDEAQGIRDQLAFEAQERRALRRDAKLGRQVDDKTRAFEWLESIRNLVASVFPCSLTEAAEVAADAENEGRALSDRQRENMRTPWLAVGRFDPVDPIGYFELAQGLYRVANDLGLEAWIHPQRLSQIRVVYADPHSVRGEGDSIVSKIGAWEFIVTEMVNEIAGVDDGDEDALMLRYEETRIPMFYIYFSKEVLLSAETTSWWKIH